MPTRHTMGAFHTLDVAATLAEQRTDLARGLEAAEAGRRLTEHGPNELVERGVQSPWVILLGQFTSTLVLLLIVAGIVSAFLGDLGDFIAIMAIVVLNALLGFREEYRAEKAVAALKKLAVPVVRVRRGGQVEEIPSSGLVPGDLVLLEAGNVVPADGRLAEAVNLRIQEAALTGESEPIEKLTETIPGEDAPVGDRRNMAFMGTQVTYGRGQVVVTATGMKTELGAIAASLQAVGHEPTPLQKRMAGLGRRLVILAVALVAVIFVVGLLRGESLHVMFLTAVSMAVAAVPEGLPAVVTITLALGAQRMLRRRALIRKLPAVETLGSVTVICSDKTGTLTENRMTVTAIETATAPLDATGGPLAAQDPTFPLLLAGGALCNDATLRGAEPPEALGDPTEAALVVAAARFGLLKPDLERALPRIAEVPFESERKRMTTVHQLPAALPAGLEPLRAALGDGATHVAFVNGAVDGLLGLSTRVWVRDHAEPMDAAWRGRLAERNEQLASDGIRVLGLAIRPMAGPSTKGGADAVEADLLFVGMFGMIDPARPEAKGAVATCRTAGIRPVMITGDHPLTARHIARSLGISDGGRIVTGHELAHMSLADLEAVVEDVSVYARVSPEHKLNIVQALQDHGHVVAMTGDGVNDAPALKKADIGVAMGITGTDVSKEASDMVLLDDNFATIVAAVEEGRVIYDNVRKFIQYLLSCNFAEVLVMVVGPLLGMPLPLLPIQILWMNLVTDGLPALALSLEPGERDVMRRPPVPPNESPLGAVMGMRILRAGILMAAATLATGYSYWWTGNGDWQTFCFTTLVLTQMSLALAARSNRESLFHMGFRSNLALLGAVLLTLVLQLAVVYVPFLQVVFKTQPLLLGELAVCLAISSVPFWGVEARKWWERRRSAAPATEL